MGVETLIAKAGRHWRLTVLVAALAAFGLRLLVIATTGGGGDLRNYVYLAQLLLAGGDPYAPPPGSPVVPVHANNPPLLIVLDAVLLRVHDSPATLRVVFALADAATIGLIGAWPGRSLRWRAGLIAFYGFSPLVLYSWTAHAQDKTLIFLGLTVLLISLDRGAHGAAWVVTALLAAVKWVGAFWALPLLLATWRARGRRAAVAGAAGFAVVFGLSHLPLLPGSLEAYARRASRLEVDPPIHAGLLRPLAEVGLYAPWLVRVLALGAMALVLLLHARRRLSDAQAVVSSFAAAYLFLPDQSDNRVLLLVLPVLYVVRLDPVRYAWTWALSTLVAATLVVQQNEVPLVPGFVDALVGEYASLQHVLIVNTLLVAVLAFLAGDVRATRTRLPSPRARARPPG